MKEYPDGRWRVFMGKILVNKSFKYLRDARKWCAWNYKGNMVNIKTVDLGYENRKESMKNYYP